MPTPEFPVSPEQQLSYLDSLKNAVKPDVARPEPQLLGHQLGAFTYAPAGRASSRRQCHFRRFREWGT
eukprot:jgi/Botrbrau1/6194/Bobra.0344s0034.1